MTTPTPFANQLSQARDVIHDALANAMELAGWTAARAHRTPPEQMPTPGAFIDAVQLDNVTTSFTATFPVVLAVDGLRQVEHLDGLTALTVTSLLAAKWQGRALTVTSVGPEDVEVVGARQALAIIIRVQLPMLLSTLCAPSLTTEETPSG